VIPADPSALDRLLLSLRTLIRAQAPTLTLFGTFEYVVHASRGSGESTVVDVSPVDTSLPLPSATNLPLRPASLGESVQGVVSGQKCRVEFLDANPAKPVVTGLQAVSGAVTVNASSSLAIGSASTPIVAIGGGLIPVGRQGDAVTISLPPPVPPPTISGLVNGLGFTGTMTGLPPAVAGMLTGGQSNVKA
jgi:hypothetical protein